MQAPAKSFWASPETWRRWSGWPRTTWMKTIQGDLSSLDLELHEAKELAQNRPLWRLMSLYCATHSKWRMLLLDWIVNFCATLYIVMCLVSVVYTAVTSVFRLKLRRSRKGFCDWANDAQHSQARNEHAMIKCANVHFRKKYSVHNNFSTRGLLWQCRPTLRCNCYRKTTTSSDVAEKTRDAQCSYDKKPLCTSY